MYLPLSYEKKKRNETKKKICLTMANYFSTSAWSRLTLYSYFSCFRCYVFLSYRIRQLMLSFHKVKTERQHALDVKLLSKGICNPIFPFQILFYVLFFSPSSWSTLTIWVLFRIPVLWRNPFMFKCLKCTHERFTFSLFCWELTGTPLKVQKSWCEIISSHCLPCFSLL